MLQVDWGVNRWLSKLISWAKLRSWANDLVQKVEKLEGR